MMVLSTHSSPKICNHIKWPGWWWWWRWGVLLSASVCVCGMGRAQLGFTRNPKEKEQHLKMLGLRFGEDKCDSNLKKKNAQPFPWARERKGFSLSGASGFSSPPPNKKIWVLKKWGGSWSFSPLSPCSKKSIAQSSLWSDSRLIIFLQPFFLCVYFVWNMTVTRPGQVSNCPPSLPAWAPWLLRFWFNLFSLIS